MIIDTVSMTLELPPRCQQRLSALLDSIHPSQKCLSLNASHRLLGELRSMSIALPGARGLFSAMQAAIRTNALGRLRLDKGFHDAIADFRWLSDSMRDRPTCLQELVPIQPALLGAHDASGRGAGDVWFPSPEAVSRAVQIHTLHQGALVKHPIDPSHPCSGASHSTPPSKTGWSLLQTQPALLTTLSLNWLAVSCTTL
jgi:hypothetical protein